MRLLRRLLLQGCIVLPLLMQGQKRGFVPGDHLTEQELSNILSTTGETGMLINKDAKLFIIDFWDVNCTSCIAAFPKMDSLQNKFDGKIQVILVNRQTKDSTERFFKKRKKIKIPELPFITGDIIINQYFQHVGEPYHVWIDSSGKVALMSYGHVSNEKNVASYLASGLLPGHTSTHAIKVKSLIDERWEPSMAYYSYLSHCIENGMVKIRPEKSEGTIIAGGCRSIVELYQIAFNERDQPYYGFGRAGRTILKVSHPEKYVAPQEYGMYNEWVMENGYDYHLYLPEQRSKEKYRIMREDLGRYFNLDVKVMKRPVESLILKRSGNSNLLVTKGGEAKDNFGPGDQYGTGGDSLRWYINKPYEGWSRQMGFMLENQFKLPFIDSTSIKGFVDIVMSGSTIDSMNLPALKSELKKYGLVLMEKKVMIDVLVIKERE